MVHAARFLLSTATFAIVDSQGQLVKKGQANHLNLAAYSAESWAVIVARAGATRRLTIYSDCSTVVQQATEIFAGASIHADWSCKEWWKFLHTLVARRKQYSAVPFSIPWIPAHCFDDLPEYLITDNLAATANTTREHIFNNRTADSIAKTLAKHLAPVQPDMQILAGRAIEQHQSWLVALHKLLPTNEQVPSDSIQTSNHNDDITLDQCRSRFPAWLWNFRSAISLGGPRYLTSLVHPCVGVTLWLIGGIFAPLCAACYGWWTQNKVFPSQSCPLCSTMKGIGWKVTIPLEPSLTSTKQFGNA